MQRIKRYFQSFDSFIQFFYGFRRRIREYYWMCFQILIQRNIEKFVNRSLDNQLFLSRIIKLLELPSELQINEQEANRIKISAEVTMQGIYNLLGSGDVNFQPIDWHTDFKSGYRWSPGTFYKKYTQEGIDSDSDVKVPRELSRCHHLLKVAIEYNLSKNENYAAFCIDQIENWIDENPLMKSINWGCTMDVSIRAVNWIWALGLISDVQHLDSNKVKKIKNSLYQHGWFIYRNPEKEVANNHNHYLADLSGQIHLGLLFQQLIEPKKWLQTGKEELFREIRMQILPSGMSYERSTNYNRLVLELILIPILLLKRAGHEIPSDIWFRLERMFEFIMYTLKPDGTSPVIGDQDNGRLLPFGTESNNNFSYLLSIGALIFNRADFKNAGNGFNLYCSILGDSTALRKWNNIPDQISNLHSKAFRDAGFFVMRKKNNYLLFNASGKGLYPEIPSGTHTHSDLLSFELVSQGKTFLVDPGSYVYTANASERMNFRSTRMHNTVTVDGESQNVLKREVLWDFERNAIPDVISWESDEIKDCIVASHNGYERLENPVRHCRTFSFEKETAIWQITDDLTGTGKHLFEWFFHFDSAIDFEIQDNTIRTNCPDNKNLLITFTGLNILELRKENTWISKGYGEKEPALVLIVSILTQCPVSLNIIIKPIQ